MWGLALGALKWVGSLFVGGSLDKILDTIDKGIDDATKREEVKADVTKKWIDAQASLLVGRTWWFQLFFVIPLAMHFLAVCFVSTFPAVGWKVLELPGNFGEYEFLIISALFMIDGSKAVLASRK